VSSVCSLNGRLYHRSYYCLPRDRVHLVKRFPTLFACNVYVFPQKIAVRTADLLHVNTSYAIVSGSSSLSQAVYFFKRSLRSTYCRSTRRCRADKSITRNVNGVHETRHTFTFSSQQLTAFVSVNASAKNC
jgi:hypothetical protein